MGHPVDISFFWQLPYYSNSTKLRVIIFPYLIGDSIGFVTPGSSITRAMWFVEAIERRHALNVHAMEAVVPGVTVFAMEIVSGAVISAVVHAI